MSQSPKPASKPAARAEPARPLREPISRLNAMMECDTAFRVVARRYLRDLTANHAPTCGGDPTALHAMRIALTHLRTAILFFSPMVADTESARIADELKWLNAHLGAVRDLDVAIERLRKIGKQQPEAMLDPVSWNARRADSHRGLARALLSARYRGLIKRTSDWIESGPWSVKSGKRATRQRACPIAAYAAGKLTRWRNKLLKKSRKLADMGTSKRHGLRLLNKKLSYSIESFEDLSADKRFSGQRAALEYLRRAQKSLGQLNDDANGQSLAAALQRSGVPAPVQFTGPKREKRLIRAAVAAYCKLAAL
jgi:CHAD domain-containing protein